MRDEDHALLLTGYQVRTLERLTARAIEFLVIGGKAMQAHQFDRESWDLDLWVSRDGDNPKSLFEHLVGEAVTSPDLSADWLRLPGKRVSLPHDERLDKEVDILTSVGALDFAAASARALRYVHNGLRVPVASVQDLIEIKMVALGSTSDRRRRKIESDDLIALRWRLSHMAPGPLPVEGQSGTP